MPATTGISSISGFATIRNVPLTCVTMQTCAQEDIGGPPPTKRTSALYKFRDQTDSDLSDISATSTQWRTFSCTLLAGSSDNTEGAYSLPDVQEPQQMVEAARKPHPQVRHFRHHAQRRPRNGRLDGDGDIRIAGPPERCLPARAAAAEVRNMRQSARCSCQVYWLCRSLAQCNNRQLHDRHVVKRSR